MGHDFSRKDCATFEEFVTSVLANLERGETDRSFAVSEIMTPVKALMDGNDEAVVPHLESKFDEWRDK